MIGKIKSKQIIAQGTLEVTFQVSEPFTFKPGQYCFVSLPNLLYQDDRGGKRHFSIINSPNEKGVIVIATRIRDSGFKKTLNELPLGSEEDLGPIAGTFTLLEDTKKPLVFIAGGIGITPYISMLRYISEEKLPYDITLIYSNKDQLAAAYLDEIKNFQFVSQTASGRTIFNFQLVLTMTDDPNWPHEKRRIDAQFLKDYIKNLAKPLYFVVGPPPMVDAVQSSLLEVGVDISNIKTENFTGY